MIINLHKNAYKLTNAINWLDFKNVIYSFIVEEHSFNSNSYEGKKIKQILNNRNAVGNVHYDNNDEDLGFEIENIQDAFLFKLIFC